MSYADFVLALHPAWLRGAWSRAWASAIGNALDAIGVRTTEAIQARLPSFAPEDSLPALGDDRALPRTTREPSKAYRSRLRRAFTTWRNAGSDRGVIDAIATLGFRARVRRNNQWNWDGHPGNVAPYWARMWIILDPPFALGPAPIAGGGAHAGDGSLCGISGDDAALIGPLLCTAHQWKASHAELVAVIVPLGGALLCGDGHQAGDGSRAGAGSVVYLEG